jgi:hypothetical protein
MADLTNYKIYKNDKYQVLTQDGFKDFKGIIKGNNPLKIRIHAYKKSLICTPKHKIMINNVDWIYAEDLNNGDKIYGGITVISADRFESDDHVYEFLEVDGGHTYLVNGILSHQCLIVDEMAHIDVGIMEEFWAAVYPTISSNDKAKVLIASTPNSVGNKFHDLWEKSHIPKSGWGYARVPWFDVPGKTEEWAAQQRIDLGDDMFEQEYECKFLEGGDSCIPEDLYNELQKRCISPRVTMYDGKYKIFAEPNIKDRIYVAGVDIGEGVGACASTINIMDVTEMTAIEQVATYHSTSVGPYEFARQLNDILGHWGKPPVAIERNNSGGGVVVTRMDKDYNYPNIIHFATKQGNMSYGHLKGVTSSTNTKYHGVMNMFYWLKTQRRVILRDIDTLKELNTFVRHKNEKWAKKSDSYLDDRVDAMLWSLIAIHEMVVKQYFTILMWDDNKKPLMLKPLYHVFDSKENRYVFGGEDNNFGVDRLIMPTFDHDPHLDEMNDIGWLLPEQAGHTPSYEPAEKYFTG